MLNYSFIIPHKNNLKLLIRCIASIPQRQDIEIIVVDDNSDENEKPVFLRKDVKILFVNADEAMGAGKARNIGMAEARGRWILFADCDDFYERDFITKLDGFVDSENDVVFFDAHFYNDSIGCSEHDGPRSVFLDKYLNRPDSKKNAAFLKHCDNHIWSRMFSKRFLDEINARFEEVAVANDLFFAHYTSAKAKKIQAISNKLYCYLKNDNSLSTSKITKSKCESRLMSGFRRNRLITRSSNAVSLAIIFPFGLYKTCLRNFGFFFFLKVMLLHARYDVSFFTIAYWKFRAKFMK